MTQKNLQQPLACHKNDVHVPAVHLVKHEPCYMCRFRTGTMPSTISRQLSLFNTFYTSAQPHLQTHLSLPINLQLLSLNERLMVRLMEGLHKGSVLCTWSKYSSLKMIIETMTLFLLSKSMRVFHVGIIKVNLTAHFKVCGWKQSFWLHRFITF